VRRNGRCGTRALEALLRSANGDQTRRRKQASDRSSGLSLPFAAEPRQAATPWRARAAVLGDREPFWDCRLQVHERSSVGGGSGHGMSTSRTRMGVVRSATNRGSSASAATGFVAETCHHSSCPPARQVDGTRPCLRGLSKPCQAANAAAHSCGSWRWCRTNCIGGSSSDGRPETSGGHPEMAP
jgi:hypothetical protein